MINDKTFWQAGDLKRHVLAVHGKEKNLECDHCDKAFTKAEHLKRRAINLHLREKNFINDVSSVHLKDVWKG